MRSNETPTESFLRVVSCHCIAVQFREDDFFRFAGVLLNRV